MRHRFAPGGACGLLLVLVLGTALVRVGPASAASGPSMGSSLAAVTLEGSSNAHAGPSRTGQVLDAYVGAGGSLDVGVAFRNDLNRGPGDHGAAQAVTITVVSPSGRTYTNTVPFEQDADVYPGASITGLSDARPGVWRIVLEDGVDDQDPDSGIYQWGVTPRDAAGAALKGRVFTENYLQSAQPMRPLDDDGWRQEDASWSQSMYFMAAHGVTYQGSFAGYNPIQGTVIASPKGVMNTSDGSSRHASASLQDASARVDPARYRIFFERPDPALPAVATWSDGRSDWVGPDFAEPLISDVSVSRTASTTDAPWAGTISWTVDGATGPASVVLDTDGDGRTDTTLTANGAATSVTWNGKTDAGMTVAASSGVTVKVAIREAAEIHITLLDVERLTGGIEVTALDGPAAGSTALSWDDSGLGGRCEDNQGVAAPCADTTSPPKASGISSAGGVHRWKVGDASAGTRGWGDDRRIDNWTSTPVDAGAVVSLPGTRLVARDDAVTTPNSTPVTIKVLANDGDADSGAGVPAGTKVTLASKASTSGAKLYNCLTYEGTWRVNPDQTVTYTPDGAFHGIVGCAYTVTTPSGETATATITVTVANDLLVRPDHASTKSGQPVMIVVTDNDGHADAESTVRLSGVSDPAQGRWELGPGDTVIFYPAATFHGVATMTYVLTESDGTHGTGTITVSVANRVEAVADAVTTNPGRPVSVNVLRNDSWVDPGSRISLVRQRGTPGTWRVDANGTVTFSPAAGFVGTAKATYTITEPDGTRSRATVTVSVGTPAADRARQTDERHGDLLPNLGGPRWWLLAVGLLAVGLGVALTRGRRNESRKER